MPIEPWWETNPATTPRQELGMVSPELYEELGMVSPNSMSPELYDELEGIGRWQAGGGCSPSPGEATTSLRAPSARPNRGPRRRIRGRPASRLCPPAVDRGGPHEVWDDG